MYIDWFLVITVTNPNGQNLNGHNGHKPKYGWDAQGKRNIKWHQLLLILMHHFWYESKMGQVAVEFVKQNSIHMESVILYQSKFYRYFSLTAGQCKLIHDIKIGHKDGENMLLWAPAYPKDHFREKRANAPLHRVTIWSRWNMSPLVVDITVNKTKVSPACVTITRFHNAFNNRQ